ncbi:MAG TPA: allophanate hydrolase, partial [Arachnia sp.]|nr:allophanate hydrolase [Arachnia sp.]
PASGPGRFVACLPQPMSIGQVSLDDGTTVTGFQAEGIAFDGAPDISAHGGWRNYLAGVAAQ